MDIDDSDQSALGYGFTAEVERRRRRPRGRGATARAGLLGVCLHDSVAGRLGALRAVVRVLDSYHFDASFLEVGAELSS